MYLLVYALLVNCAPFGFLFVVCKYKISGLIIVQQFIIHDFLNILILLSLHNLIVAFDCFLGVQI